MKLRFREARNGKDALSFNVYLSPYDVWTAAAISLDRNGPANLLTRDASCTVPAIRTNSSLQSLADGTRYAPFRNFAYSGSNNDNGGQSLLRTREGFIEVIEMGELAPGSAPTQVLEEITHTSSNGTPNSEVPTNCNLPIADAVSAVLMQEWVAGDFDTETAIGASTEWVQTFPTKAYYVDFISTARLPFTDPFRDDGHGCERIDPRPFDREALAQGDPAPPPCPFELCPPLPPGPAPVSLCFESQVLAFNQTLPSMDSLTLEPTAIFGSNGGQAYAPRARSAGPAEDRGWLSIGLQQLRGVDPVGARTLSSLEGDIYHGLPVIGFVAMNYINGNAQAGRLANYSGAVPLRGGARVVRAGVP